MSAKSTNLAARRFTQKNLMTEERARVTRVSGEKVWDEESGEWTFAEVTMYEGPFFEFTYAGYESNMEAGGRRVPMQRSEAWFPVGSFKSIAGDRVEVIESRSDPLRVGKVMYLAQECPFKTFEDAYRVFVDTEGQGQP